MGDSCAVNSTSHSCDKPYLDSSAGIALITARYSGDDNNLPSVGSYTLTVFKPTTYISFHGEQSPGWSGHPFNITVGVRTAPTLPGSLSLTGNVSFSSVGPVAGTFSPSSCSLSVNGSNWFGGIPTCNTEFIPSSYPSPAEYDELVATYSGDGHFTGSSVTTPIYVVEQGSSPTSITNIWCSSEGYLTMGAMLPDQDAVCTASVTPNTGPSGTVSGVVTFKSSSQSGNFSNGGTCSVSGTGDAFCTVNYNDTYAGQLQITASFSGSIDGFSSQSSYTTTMTELKWPTHVQVDCGGNAILEGQFFGCSAFPVGGADLIGNSSITFSSTSLTGYFLKSEYTNVQATTCYNPGGYGGECELYYNDTTPGTYTITARFSGDAYNDPSSGSTVITVISSSPSATVASSTTSTLSSASSSTPSTTTSGSPVTSATSSPGGIPAFPYQLAAVVALTVVVASSYLLTRRRLKAA